MSEITEILTAFGFTAGDAKKIAVQVEENGLSLEDVQAWIDEAQASNSLHNPHGFVRARLQDGDKMPSLQPLERRHVHRQRYKTQFSHAYPDTPHNEPDLTQTCTCGKAFWKTSFCEHCGKCPDCCTCASTDTHKE